jgi:hypothetical protein
MSTVVDSFHFPAGLDKVIVWGTAVDDVAAHEIVTSEIPVEGGIKCSSHDSIPDPTCSANQWSSCSRFILSQRLCHDKDI